MNGEHPINLILGGGTKYFEALYNSVQSLLYIILLNISKHIYLKDITSNKEARTQPHKESYMNHHEPLLAGLFLLGNKR